MDQEVKDSVQRMRVQIYGEQYALRGEATLDHLQTIAEHVDKTMTQISEANPRLDAQRIAVLAAINLADQYLRLKEEYDELLRVLERE